MRRKVLIVDDDIVTLKLLKKHLEDEYEVQTENAGYRVVEKMDTYEGVDVILLDVEMPIMNGLRVFEEIKKNPKMKTTRVIFLVGGFNPNLSRRLFERGEAGYISKTASKEEYISTITKILEMDCQTEPSTNILVIHGDINIAKKMRETLTENLYTVKICIGAYEAARYMKNHRPDLVIIGEDYSGADAKEVYKVLSGILFAKNIQSITIEEPCFSIELIDRVKKALG